MKNPNNTILKTYLLLAFSLFAVFVITSDMREGSRPAQAGNGQNMSGWAWAETIGWISFNSDDCENDGTNFTGSPPGCPTTAVIDYGVNIDMTKNPMELSGYAWSENVGWISFQREPIEGNPPFPPYNGGSGPVATFSLGTLKMSGWAKILSLGDDGWIKLASSTETPGDTMNYAVELNPSWGEFAGWAWNGNDTASTGIGWISFNHMNQTPPGPHYAVTVLVPTKPNNLKITNTDVDSCHTLHASWDDSSYEEGYNIYMHDDSPVPLDDTHRIRTLSAYIRGKVDMDTDDNLLPGEGYNFKVQAYNFFGFSTSDQVQGTTSPICKVLDGNDLVATGKCPKTIKLTWKEPVHGAGCTIDKYFIRRCTCTTTDNCNNCNCTNGFNCNPEVPSPYSYASSTIGNELTFNDESFDLPSKEQKKAYKYIVSGHCSSGESGEWSLPSNQEIPCKTKPKFIEDKPGN